MSYTKCFVQENVLYTCSSVLDMCDYKAVVFSGFFFPADIMFFSMNSYWSAFAVISKPELTVLWQCEMIREVVIFLYDFTLSFCIFSSYDEEITHS